MSVWILLALTTFEMKWMKKESKKKAHPDLLTVNFFFFQFYLNSVERWFFSHYVRCIIELSFHYKRFGVNLEEILKDSLSEDFVFFFSKAQLVFVQARTAHFGLTSGLIVIKMIFWKFTVTPRFVELSKNLGFWNFRSLQISEKSFKSWPNYSFRHKNSRWKDALFFAIVQIQSIYELN